MCVCLCMRIVWSQDAFQTLCSVLKPTEPPFCGSDPQSSPLSSGWAVASNPRSCSIEILRICATPSPPQISKENSLQYLKVSFQRLLLFNNTKVLLAAPTQIFSFKKLMSQITAFSAWIPMQSQQLLNPTKQHCWKKAKQNGLNGWNSQSFASRVGLKGSVGIWWVNTSTNSSNSMGLH